MNKNSLGGKWNWEAPKWRYEQFLTTNSVGFLKDLGISLRIMIYKEITRTCSSVMWCAWPTLLTLISIKHFPSARNVLRHTLHLSQFCTYIAQTCHCLIVSNCRLKLQEEGKNQQVQLQQETTMHDKAVSHRTLVPFIHRLVTDCRLNQFIIMITADNELLHVLTWGTTLAQ